ncbi:uncharacterized protein zgc:113279 isoform X2 [Phyllopteryx taeniolatus]|uniref:uncharacterized protein zgc:113279 isoform X2 n=1 Tax=Phyllopteryx taeniolatus TaxID=161469 RepID=UPI002AD30888|nr:uncharacterized protein zgc:113279 isoform X2 [Phyllopteryx taeniolatus]
MRGRYKQLEGKERVYGSAHPVSQPPGSAAHTASDLSIQEADDWETAPKRSSEDVQKVYLGVRVKMPVKDLLRNIRIAQGRDPKDLQNLRTQKVQVIRHVSFSGDKKRVQTCTGNRTSKRKRTTSGLEELAIIVEVLEEDLRTDTTNRSLIQMSSPSSPVSPEYTSETNGTGYNSDESDEIIPSPPSHTIYSPGTAEYQQTLPPPEAMVTSYQPAWITDYWFTNCPVSSSEFFWAQLQKEEIKLRTISDEALLATNKHSRTALHSVVCDGNRALAYAIAKRLAPLNSLDLKDSNGMTALLLAAKHNHHLIVEDLINLGARVSERNNSGKSCLHLSAEKGFIRVLEVLKRVMMEGVYIDVEATDKSGMSVLQCASVALKVTLQQLELRKSLNHTKLHTLRKEQLLKTLECLLQMASYSHVMGTWGMNA